MKRTCEACRGEGKIDDAGYRDNARAVVPPPPKSARLPINWKRVWIFGARVLGFLTAGIVLATCMKACYDEDQKKIAAVHADVQWRGKMGYVVAQYDASGRVTRCWVVGPRLDGYWVYDSDHQSYGRRPSGPDLPMQFQGLGWIEVPDRSDIDGFARRMGIEQPTACARLDQ